MGIKSDLEKLKIPIDLQYEIIASIERYERLRLFYIDELTFQVDLLLQVEKMHKIKIYTKNESFLGFNKDTASGIRKLEGLLKYLNDNPDTWDWKYYDEVIQSLPKHKSI